MKRRMLFFNRENNLKFQKKQICGKKNSFKNLEKGLTGKWNLSVKAEMSLEGDKRKAAQVRESFCCIRNVLFIYQLLRLANDW